MRLLKALIITVVAAGALFGIWEFYSSSNDTQKMPERYMIVDRLEKEGLISFNRPMLDGKSYSTDLAKGKVMILNFWASWCAPCVAEFPAMIKLVNKFPGQIEFIAVSQDRSVDDIHTFFKSIEERSDYLRLLWDEDKSLGQTYGVERLPESFIFAKNGKLVKKIIGLQEWGGEDAEGFFKALVNEPQ